MHATENDTWVIGPIIAREQKRSCTVVAGPQGLNLNPVNGELLGTAYYVDDDAELLEKTKHVRLKNEVMGQFHARVGLGAAQILSMTKDEIAHFVAVVTAREEHWKPRVPLYFQNKTGKCVPVSA